MKTGIRWHWQAIWHNLYDIDFKPCDWREPFWCECKDILKFKASWFIKCTIKTECDCISHGGEVSNPERFWCINRELYNAVVYQ